MIVRQLTSKLTSIPRCDVNPFAEIAKRSSTKSSERKSGENETEKVFEENIFAVHA